MEFLDRVYPLKDNQLLLPYCMRWRSGEDRKQTDPHQEANRWIAF